MSDKNLQAEASTMVEIIIPPQAPGNLSDLNRTIPGLPPLAPDETMVPVLLDGA